MKIGIIKEGKTPPDSRVPITPKQCRQFIEEFNVELVVQSSPSRCYKDQEYIDEDVTIVENIDDCDVLMGVKEVNISDLIENKQYFFFSHTIKMQPYNQKLLKAIVEKNIQLVDYEVITNERKKRLIAFGVFAGMVGAHNALWTYGNRTKLFQMKRLKDCFDYAEAVELYKTMEWPAVKIVLSGTGRVSTGAARVLTDMGISMVSPEAFLNDEFDKAVFCQLGCDKYVKHKEKENFEKRHFYNNPSEYVSIFDPYYETADIFINGIYWDNDAPAFFTKDEMKQDNFNIKVISDVTCDIAPVSSIPSTLIASTIADPVFGYDPMTEKIVEPYQASSIDMMTIDNLPNELPRDASFSFGEQFLTSVAKELLDPNSEVILRGSVTKGGKLGPYFDYLSDYLAGK